MSGNGVLWTPERDEILRTKWAEGTKTADIAVELGGFEHTKDGGKGAVLGRAHRLKLAARSTGKPRLDPAEAERRRKEHNRKRSDRRRRQRAESGQASSQHANQNKRIQEVVARHKAAALPAVSKTSPAYRNQLPTIGNLSKNELRAMIAEAARNTAEMSV